jgi:hypothetical protein
MNGNYPQNNYKHKIIHTQLESVLSRCAPLAHGFAALVEAPAAHGQIGVYGRASVHDFSNF